LNNLNYQERIKLFYDLFKGRRDVYPVYWKSTKTGKSGYSPVCINEWERPICLKTRGGKCKDCNFRENAEFTKEIVEKHLLGKIVAGIYPMMEDNTTYFLAVDFDKKEWKKEVINFLEACKEYDMPAYLERSRSGDGGHVWIFFTDKYPAIKSREIAFYLLEKSGIISSLSKEQSFDRVFPNQDILSLKGYGNLIALPLQAESRKENNSVFVDPETFKPYEDQWSFLQNIKKVSPEFLDKLLNNIDKGNLVKDCNIKKLQIFQSNCIKLKKSQLNRKLINFIKEELNIPNPEYFSKKRLGKSVYKIPQYFCAIKEEEKEISIPRGFLRKLIEFCIKESINYELKTEKQKYESVSFKSKIKPYSHQEDILRESEKYPEGVIVAPAGSGKTIIGLQIIAEKKLPAIILVHRKQIFEQWIEKIESFLNIHKKDIGQISATKKKLGEKINVAMMQSLKSIENKELHQFGTVIVDECHHIPANTFRECIERFTPKYLYGLTATAKRKHGDENLIFAYIGDIISEIELKEENKSQVISKVEIIETLFYLPFEVNSNNLQQALKILIFDSRRNELIAEKILENVENGKCLVITERKDHTEILNLYLKEKVETLVFTGELTPKQRKIKFDQIKFGNFEVLIATGQIFGEGVDIASLDILFLVFPFSFEGKLIQYIGRIQRSENENKKVFDFRDVSITYFDRMFKQRKKYYDKIKRDKQLKLL